MGPGEAAAREAGRRHCRAERQSLPLAKAGGRGGRRRGQRPAGSAAGDHPTRGPPDHSPGFDAACARLEAEARAEAAVERAAYEEKKAAYEAKKGRRGRPPKPPDETPLPTRQSNLTDPDSALMRRSDAHEHRQAYNAQAVVCAEGTQLILLLALGSRFRLAFAGMTDQYLIKSNRDHAL